MPPQLVVVPLQLLQAVVAAVVGVEEEDADLAFFFEDAVVKIERPSKRTKEPNAAAHVTMTVCSSLICSIVSRAVHAAHETESITYPHVDHEVT